MDASAEKIKDRFFYLNIIIFLFFEISFIAYFCYFYSEYIYFLPAFIILTLAFLYVLINEKFWLTTLFLCFIPLFLIESKEISIMEVGLAVYIYIPLFLWFFKKIFVLHQNIFESFSDYLLMFFLFLCYFSVIFTINNNFNFLGWFREIIVFSIFLLYFPLRDFLRKDKKNIFWVLGPFCLMSLIIAFFNIFKYKSKITLAKQFFEVYGSRVGHTEQLFLFFILVIFSLIFIINSKKSKYLLFSTLIVFILALILTFTRSYIFAGIIGIALLILIAERKERKKMIFWIGIAITIFLLLMFIFFSNLANYIFQALLYRFLGTGKTDISLIQRVIESEAVINQIISNPMLGWGLGATFRRYDLFFQLHLNTDYCHNAYLYIWFKLGIIGLLSFLIMYLLKIYEGWKTLRKIGDKYIKRILIAVLITLLEFIFISITSPQFYHRPSILIIVTGWAIFSAYSTNKKSKSGNL